MTIILYVCIDFILHIPITHAILGKNEYFVRRRDDSMLVFFYTMIAFESDRLLELSVFATDHFRNFFYNLSLLVAQIHI
jgi:hypothetical protein